MTSTPGRHRLRTRRRHIRDAAMVLRTPLNSTLPGIVHARQSVLLFRARCPIRATPWHECGGMHGKVSQMRRYARSSTSKTVHAAQFVPPRGTNSAICTEMWHRFVDVRGRGSKNHACRRMHGKVSRMRRNPQVGVAQKSCRPASSRVASWARSTSTTRPQRRCKRQQGKSRRAPRRGYT